MKFEGTHNKYDVSHYEIFSLSYNSASGYSIRIKKVLFYQNFVLTMECYDSELEKKCRLHTNVSKLNPTPEIIL